MFHVGKIVRVFKVNEKEVFGADSSVQAMVLMWDENLITVSVKSGIADKIKENDIVLVDYAPSSPNIPVPKQVITKILRGETAKKTWKEYEEFSSRKRREQDYSGQPMTNVR